MSKSVADHLWERLGQWNVERVFGYPGDGIMGALGRVAERFDYVRVRHEEMAAFMACAHAKFTGEVGVCLATSDPAPSTCSTACTTPRWTICRWSPWWASRPPRRWVAATNRKSTCTPCSRTSPPMWRQ